MDSYCTENQSLKQVIITSYSTLFCSTRGRYSSLPQSWNCHSYCIWNSKHTAHK